MFNSTQPLLRRSIPLAAAAALAVTSLCSFVARAQDKMGMDQMGMGDKKMASMPPLTADEQKMVMDHLSKAKAMASDPAAAEKMTAEMAKMMVMEHMAMQIAMDPQAKSAMSDAMADPALKKVHEDAKKMAMDPDQMAKTKAEVMADPMAMKVVMHDAAKMAAMHDKAAEMKMDGGKMMDHARDEMGK